MAMYPLPEAESPTSSDISSTFQMSGAPSGRCGVAGDYFLSGGAGLRGHAVLRCGAAASKDRLQSWGALVLLGWKAACLPEETGRAPAGAGAGARPGAAAAQLEPSLGFPPWALRLAAPLHTSHPTPPPLPLRPPCRLAADDGTLFNMDEDVSSRSPPATSPRAAAVLGAAHALLAAKAIPVTPVTPLAAAGPGAAAFSSPLSAVASLGNSLESMTIAEALLPRTSSLARSDGLPQADSAAFLGPASYAPPGFRMPATHAKPRERRAAGRHRRRRAAPTSRLRKTNGQYPPLVEARCSGPGAIFAGLTDGGWEHFMLIVRHAIDSALEAGAWKQSALSTTAQPPASCPRF